MQTINVFTQFDCTPTGVQGHKRYSGLSNEEYQTKRNQQRNWETFLQCVGLRCQPLDIAEPFVVYDRNSTVFGNQEWRAVWHFAFSIDKPDVFRRDNDELGLLKQDCDRVPMIIGLSEEYPELFFTPYISCYGKYPNTFFRTSGQ